VHHSRIHFAFWTIENGFEGITLNFASEGGDALIGVYSGHGEKGKQCANFCEVMLPRQLAKFIRQKRVQRYTKTLKAEGKMKKGAWNPKMWPILSATEYEQCCQRAFHETKNMLQQEKEVRIHRRAVIVS
jgi:serine/threonine protein phosphatase PrpC